MISRKRCRASPSRLAASFEEHAVGVLEQGELLGGEGVLCLVVVHCFYPAEKVGVHGDAVAVFREAGGYPLGYLLHFVAGACRVEVEEYGR